MSDGTSGTARERGARNDGRTDARERALTLLYESEQREQPVAVVAEGHAGYLEGMAGELALGVESMRPTVDAAIVAASTSWPLERMAAIDRAILRIATFEIMERSSTPVAVIIDEAVEMAKRFSTESSGRFVNGVLSAVGRAVRSEA